MAFLLPLLLIFEEKLKNNRLRRLKNRRSRGKICNKNSAIKPRRAYFCAITSLPPSPSDDFAKARSA